MNRLHVTSIFFSFFKVLCIATSIFSVLSASHNGATVSEAQLPKIISMFLSPFSKAQEIRELIQAQPALLHECDPLGRGLVYYAAQHKVDRYGSQNKNALLKECIEQHGLKVMPLDAYTIQPNSRQPRRFGKHGSTLLHYAAKHAPWLIKPCVDAGLDINVRNSRGKTPLYALIDYYAGLLPRMTKQEQEACKLTIAERVTTLCLHGADPEATRREEIGEDQASLWRVVYHDIGIPVARALLEENADPREALYCALTFGKSDYKNLLAHYNAYLTNPNDILKLMAHHDDEVFQDTLSFVGDLNCRDAQGYTPLCGAIKSKQYRRFLALLSRGASACDTAALFTVLNEMRSITPAYDMASYLLSHGTKCTEVLNQDLQDEWGSAIVKQGMTPALYVHTDRFFGDCRDYYVVLHALINAMKSRCTLRYDSTLVESKSDVLLQKAGGQLSKEPKWHMIGTSSDSNTAKVQKCLSELGKLEKNSVLYAVKLQMAAEHMLHIDEITDLIAGDSESTIAHNVVKSQESTLIHALCTKMLLYDQNVGKLARERHKEAVFTAERVMLLLISKGVDQADTLIEELIAHQDADWAVPARLWDATCNMVDSKKRANILSVLAKRSSITMYDHAGETTLMRLAQDQYDRSDGVQALVSYAGIDVDQPALYTGSTALHYAVLYGNASIAAVLLEAGANQHTCNAFGQSPEEINSMIVDHARHLPSLKKDPYERYAKALAIADVLMRHELHV